MSGAPCVFLAYYFSARAWGEVCGPSASFGAEELRVGERLPLVGAAASHEFWGSSFWVPQPPNKYLDFIFMFF